MSLTVPYRIGNGVGHKPDADELLGNFDFLTALAAGNYLLNPGFESWNGGTSFSNPATLAALADSWTMTKGGTSSPSVNVDREPTTIDTGTYSMKLTLTGAGSANSTFVVKQSISTPVRFKTETVLFSVRVKASNANKVRLKVTDGTTTAVSSYHAGDGNWALLQVSMVVGSSPSELTCSITIDPSDFTASVYVDSAYLYVIPASMLPEAYALLPFIAFQAVPDYLPKTGGTMTGAITMSGANIVMGSNKITGLANGTATGDAVNLDQLQTKSVNIADNGGFEICQRGTSSSAPANNTYGTVDRWKVQNNEATNVTMTKETTTIDALGLASVKVVVTSSGASKYWQIMQNVENYADYRGKTITVSCRVKTTVASAVRVSIYDGVTQTFSSYHTGSGNFETLTCTATIVSTCTDFELIVGMCAAGDKKDGTYYFDSFMAVEGAIAATFYPTNPAVDLARCQRFYFRFGDGNANEQISNGHCYSTTQGLCAFQFPVTMRVAPTISVVAATNFSIVHAGTTTNTSSLTVGVISIRSCQLQPAVAAGLTAGRGMHLATNATTSYIEFSADL